METKCPKCKVRFPENLVKPMLIAGPDGQSVMDRCPICALQDRNEIHGLGKETPFGSQRADEMFKQSVEHLQKQTKPIDAWVYAVYKKL
jgi:hypothetical protein